MCLEGKTLRRQVTRVLRVPRSVTGVVHLQHAILFAGRSENVVVVHHHDRRIDGIPPVLVTSEEDTAALELGDGEIGRVASHVLEGADERALVRLVLLLDVEQGAFDESERERRRLHVEEARTDALVSLEDGVVEGRGLNDGNGVVVDDDVGVGVQDVDAESQNGEDDGELEGGDLVEGGGGLFDEGGGDGVGVGVVEGDGDVHGLEELGVRRGRGGNGVGELVLCDDEEGGVLGEVAVLIEVDGEESVGVGGDGDEDGVVFLSGEHDVFEAVHWFGGLCGCRHGWLGGYSGWLGGYSGCRHRRCHCR